MLNISLKFYNLICKNMEVYVKYHTNSFEHVKLSPVNRKKKRTSHILLFKNFAFNGLEGQYRGKNFALHSVDHSLISRLHGDFNALPRLNPMYRIRNKPLVQLGITQNYLPKFYYKLFRDDLRITSGVDAHQNHNEVSLHTLEGLLQKQKLIRK